MKLSAVNVVAVGLLGAPAAFAAGDASSNLRGLLSPFTNMEKSCLTSAGDGGKEGRDYENFGDIPREKCENNCLNSSDCFGYEFRTGKCEIWILPINKKQTWHNGGPHADCYIKN